MELTQDEKDLISLGTEAFYAALLKNLRLDMLRQVITIKHVSGPDQHEYSDYRNITHGYLGGDAIDKAAELGSGVATFYNGLIQDAYRVTGKKIVSDLLDDNLKFNLVINNTPSVADPACVIPGWISYRFYFRSTDKLTPEIKINGHQETMRRVEARK